MKISVSMITLNEEKYIARALSSCSFADEIVVVDGGSTDRTLEILRAHAKVILIQHPWKNHFGKQRQVCLEHCTGDWVVRLDSDEAFSAGVEENIRDLLASAPADIAGYKIRQCNLVGNEDYYSKKYDNHEAIPRIWRNRSEIKWERHIHEILSGFNGRIEHWDVYIVHYGFLDKERYRHKGQFYSRIPKSGYERPERLYYREYDIQPRPAASAVGPHVPKYEIKEDPASLPEIAIVRGPDLNKSELRSYELLADRFSITVYSNDAPGSGPEDINLPVVKLPSAPDNPSFLQGLEFELFDKDIIFAADCSALCTVQAAVAGRKFRKKIIVFESGNIFSALKKEETARRLRQLEGEFVDIFVAGSESVKDALLSRGVSGEKIVIIPLEDMAPETAAREVAALFEIMLNRGGIPGCVRETGEDPDDLKPQINAAVAEERFADAKNLMEEHFEMHLADLDMRIRHAGVCMKLGACGAASDSIDKVLLFRPDMAEALALAEEIKTRGKGQGARVKGNDKRRLNVLMASISSPISSPFYYEKALRKMCNVVTFGPWRDSSFWSDFTRSLKTHYYYREGSIEHWMDICTRLTRPCDIVTQQGAVDIRDILRQLPSDFRPDLFLWIDQNVNNVPVNLEYLDCPRVALFGDTHLGDINSRLQYAVNYDYVFVMFNRQHVPHFREAGCRKVFWSPAACDPEIHCKISADKIYPVSFVGSTHPYLHQDRVRLLDFLIRRNIDVFVDSKLLQEMSLIFSRSKMVLNRSLADDLNQRVFEALGTGSLLLTNRLGRDSGLEDLFKDRQHLVLYDNQEDLAGLVRYYLEHEDEREKIALAGYNEVLGKHTYDRRVEDIIRTVLNDISRGPEAKSSAIETPA
ncbi:MAG: glycosyltransferase [Nitrospirae bacterium]|nr:glycosyltransferase [Nitrospirota bacterium]